MTTATLPWWDWPHVDSNRRGWLRTLLGELVPRLVAEPDAGDPPAEVSDAWLEARLGALGFGALPLMPPELDAVADRGSDRLFLSVIARLVGVIAAIGRAFGAAREERGFTLDAAVVLTAFVGRTAGVEALSRLAARPDADDDEVQGTLRAELRATEEELERLRLPADHPLRDGTFHRLQTYADATLVGVLARAYYAETFDEDARLTLIGAASVKRLSFIEAVAGLIVADGRVDAIERRLVRELIRMGRFSKAEASMLRAALESEPPAPEELARVITDPVDRRFIVKLVVFAALIDGELDSSEERYIVQLAQAFGIPFHEVIALHVEIGRLYESRPGLTAALKTGGLVRRAHRAAYRMVERVVRRNARALIGEVRQTGDLFQLLAKRSRGELEPDEARRMRAQLSDIAKTIPSLAILAAPGGSVLLPVLEKVLPFSLKPSEWKDQDEAVGGAAEPEPGLDPGLDAGPDPDAAVDDDATIAGAPGPAAGDAAPRAAQTDPAES